MSVICQVLELVNHLQFLKAILTYLKTHIYQKFLYNCVEIKGLIYEIGACEKFECVHLVSQYIKLALYSKFLKLKQNFQKKKLLAKLLSLRQVDFVLPILFVLTLAFDRAIFLWKWCVFNLSTLDLKKVRPENFFKVTALKTFEISSDCCIKICRSTNRVLF